MYLIITSEKGFRDAVALANKPLMDELIAIRSGLADARAVIVTRITSTEALLSELLDAVHEQNAALETLKTNLATETEQINAKLDELSGGGDVAEAVAAIRGNTERINEAAAAISAIIPDAPEP